MPPFLPQVTNAAQSAAQHDDESWELATSTLAAVVPAWLQSGRSLDDLLSGAADTLPGIPAARRSRLLQTILTSLPEDHAEEGLKATLMLLLRRLLKARQTAAADSGDAMQVTLPLL